MTDVSTYHFWVFAFFHRILISVYRRSTLPKEEGCPEPFCFKQGASPLYCDPFFHFWFSFSCFENAHYGQFSSESLFQFEKDAVIVLPETFSRIYPLRARARFARNLF